MQQRITRTTPSADGTRIAYEVTGAGPVIVFVEPAGGHRASGPLGVLAGMMASDFTVVTYDRRGRGESGDTAPYAVQREVEDLAAVIQAAGGSVSVYGFSSGAVLALHAAAAGVPMRKLVVFEPPVATDEQPISDSLADELSRLTSAGKNAEAVEHFQRSIGVPDALIEAMRGTPMWTATVAIAPTLVYDCRVTESMTRDLIRKVRVPTLILDSEATTGLLPGWAAALKRELPDAQHRSLPGQWHWAREEDQLPVLTGFLRGEGRA